MELEAENDRPRRPRSWTGWKLALRAAISLALVTYLASTADVRQIAEALPSVSWPLWLLALGLLLGSQVLSANRWAVLARAVGFRHTRLHYLRLYFQGMFFNLCLPSAIGGDAFKALRLGASGADRALAGCTVLADRAGGMAVLLLIGGAALTVFPLASRGMSPPMALAIVAGAAIVVLIAGIAMWRLCFDLVRRVPTFGSLLIKLEPYRTDTAVLVQAIAYSAAIQTMNVSVVWCLALAMHLDLSLRACCVAVPAAAVLATLPVSISGIGLRETALAAILARHGIDLTAGAMLGIVWFSVIAMAGLVGGLVYLAEMRPLERERLESEPGIAYPRATGT